MTTIDLTAGNEAAAREMYAEDMADHALRIHQLDDPETRVQRRVAALAEARKRWDAGEVPGELLFAFRDRALAVTKNVWRDIARQAWDEGAKATYEWILARQNAVQRDEPTNPYEVQR